MSAIDQAQRALGAHAGVKLMARAGTDTGARATGRAPDPSEEEEEADRSRAQPRGVLEDRPPPA